MLKSSALSCLDIVGVSKDSGPLVSFTTHAIVFRFREMILCSRKAASQFSEYVYVVKLPTCTSIFRGPNMHLAMPIFSTIMLSSYVIPNPYFQALTGHQTASVVWTHAITFPSPEICKSWHLFRDRSLWPHLTYSVGRKHDKQGERSQIAKVV